MILGGKVKIGDKVKEDYLGNGEIVDDLNKNIRGAFMVKFDKDPPIRYNMGNNPTLIFGSELILQEPAS